MIYRKNLYTWEQLLRIGAGLLLAAYGLWSLSGSLAGYSLAVCGVSLGLTGVFGFCPMCAMAGRQLESQDARS